MNLPRSVGDVLDDHVTLEVESVDRHVHELVHPQADVPAGVVGFFKGHRGMPFASGALMDPITKTFVAGIHRYVKDHDLDLVHFVKGERKDDITQRYLAGHDGGEGILWVGRAQEKCSVFRTEKRVNPNTGARLPVHREGLGGRQPVLFLRFRRRLRSVLHQVRHLFSLHRQMLHQRPSLGATPSHQGRHRFRILSTTASYRATTRRRFRRSAPALGPPHMEPFVRKMA